MSDSRLECAKQLRRGSGVDLGDSEIIYFEQNKFEIHYLNIDNMIEIQNEPGSYKRILGLIRRYYERYPLLYVNAYAVSRFYAHPAEGGIWLDSGEALASIPVRKGKDNIDVMKKHLRDIFEDEYAGNRSRYSAAAGSSQNLEIYLEDHPAEHFPSEPYVYE